MSPDCDFGLKVEIYDFGIWNWDEKKFELAWRTPPGEDATAVAFHPSGFHILAAVGDKFYMMNVLSNSLFDYHSF